MAENILINGETYNGVESVELNTTDGKKVLYFQGQPVTVVQETGSDEAAVMSQKAVTAALTGITLGYHTDGLIYIFVNGQPVGIGLELSAGGDVVGFVDMQNNIVVKGNLADGTYSVKYEMEDGSTVNIGNLVLDTNVYYSVTNNLTNCTSDNSETQASQGKSYSAVISAVSGYELSSVMVKMGGVDITASAVSGGNISIAEVTGNIVITAVAEEIVAKYTNLADPTSPDWAEGKRFNSSGSLVDVDAGVNGATTNYIGGDFVTGDVIRIDGMDLTGSSYRTAIYNKDKGKDSLATLSGQSYYFDNLSVNSSGASFTINDKMPSGGYIRFAGILNGTSADVIITKNEVIE